MEQEQVYTQPRRHDGMPAEIVRALDGDNLEARLEEAIRLSTVTPDGWPHAAELTVGEILSLGPHNLMVAIWPESHTTANMRRSGRVTLSLVSDYALFEIRGQARLVAERQTSLGLAVFRIRVEQVQEHRSAYADVMSGLNFRLHNPQRTLARWREQIEALKKLA